MLPSQTVRYGDLLKEFHDGLKAGNLSPARMDEIQRVFNELSDRETIYRSWIKAPSILDFNARIHGTQADFDVPASRGINYTAITNGAIANMTWTDLAFGDDYGFLTFSDVCMVRKTGSTTRYVRNPIVPARTSIMVIAAVDFNVGGVAQGAFSMSIDSYRSGSYYGSFVSDANYNPADFNYHSIVCVGHDAIADDEELAVSVYQDTGAAMTLISADVAFFIA